MREVAGLAVAEQRRDVLHGQGRLDQVLGRQAEAHLVQHALEACVFFGQAAAQRTRRYVEFLGHPVDRWEESRPREQHAPDVVDQPALPAELRQEQLALLLQMVRCGGIPVRQGRFEELRRKLDVCRRAIECNGAAEEFSVDGLPAMTVVRQRHLVECESLSHGLGQVDQRSRAISVVQEVQHVLVDVEPIDE